MAAGVLLAGCVSPAPPAGLCIERDGIAECGRETGVVVAVHGSGPAAVERFTLRTADGRVIEFQVERLDVSGGGKPAAHLREHQIDGQPIEVEYRLQDGRYIALRYVDAD